MSAQAPTVRFPFDLYRAIGDDRYVTPGELPPESGDAGRALWEVYDRHFGRFTGAGLDPSFSRFSRPDVAFGQPRFSPGSPVLVVGAGPGLDAAVADLRAVRPRVIVISDAAGAAALQHHGLGPDLVIVGRETAGRADAAGDPLHLGSRVALLIEPSAPIASFERSAGTRRLARDLPSWGVWPATAVAVALRAGASRLVTIGLDGTTDADERARTDALLTALALHAPADCLEVGRVSGRAGWWPVSWPNVVPGDAPDVATLAWQDIGDASLLRAEAECDLLFLAPLLPHARQALALARRARAGETVSSRDLSRAIEMLLVWGADPSIRWALQRALGLTFLPRLWRTGVSMAAPQRLWRPLVLALHEMVEQADRFESRLTTLTQTPPPPPEAPAATTLDPGGLERKRPSRLDAGRVSVIIPVFDDHPHLEDAVASLAGQTYGEVEILVVHDAARAGRCEALRRLPISNVRVLPHEGSYVEAVNAAIEAATGIFVVVHGADDQSHPQRLARQIAYLHAHPEIGVLASATGTIDGAHAGRVDDQGDDAASWTPDAIAQRLRSGPCFEHGSAIARREAVRAAGGYRLRAGPPPDHDLWLRLVPQVRFAKLPTRLYLRR